MPACVSASLVNFKQLIIPYGLTHEEILLEIKRKASGNPVGLEETRCIDYRLIHDVADSGCVKLYYAEIEKSHIDNFKNIFSSTSCPAILK